MFTADDPSDTFLCALDGDARDVCEFDATIGPLSEGTHTLTVWAVDDFDGTIGDPADFTFTVDRTDPDAPDIEGPPAMTNDADAPLTFTGSEDGGSYDCWLDGDPFPACASPFDARGCRRATTSSRSSRPTMRAAWAPSARMTGPSIRPHPTPRRSTATSLP